MILVKLELWEFGIVFNESFWSATYLCLRYASAKCGRLSPFRGIVFCNLGTSKTVISNFVTTRQILLPHILPHVNMTTPIMFPVEQKASAQKNPEDKKSLILK
jgi:hypothetical protein